MVAVALYEKLGEDVYNEDSTSVLHLVHDSYYKDQSHKPVDERARTNFDHPDSLETNLLIQHLRELKSGQDKVEIPSYDFATHTRISAHSTTIRQSADHPIRIIILEGILVLTNRELLNEMDIRVFVDAEADIRFIRRLARDVEDRGRTMQDVIYQYQETVRPMHDLFVEPSKKNADMIVYSEGHSMDTAIEMLWNYLKIKAGMMWCDVLSFGTRSMWLSQQIRWNRESTERP